MYARISASLQGKPNIGGMADHQRANVHVVEVRCLGVVVVSVGAVVVVLITVLVNVHKNILGVSAVVERNVGGSIPSHPTKKINLENCNIFGVYSYNHCNQNRMYYGNENFHTGNYQCFQKAR